nr:amino acid ABC transporter permease [Maliibacterium massiliense]
MSYLTNMDKLGKLLLALVEGSGVTLTIFVVTLLLSVPLGFFSSLGSLSKNKVVRGLINVYVLVFRGTPLMLQILFIYFGINMLGLGLDRHLAAILSITINYAAYFSEIFRGGIQSMPLGQFEAADVLGLTHSQTMRRIILPQMFKNVFPSVGNEVINLIKDTALTYTIGVSELLRVGNNAMMGSGSIIPLLIAGLFYLAMNAVVSRGLHWGEKRLSYYR